MPWWPADELLGEDPTKKLAPRAARAKALYGSALDTAWPLITAAAHVLGSGGAVADLLQVPLWDELSLFEKEDSLAQLQNRWLLRYECATSRRAVALGVEELVAHAVARSLSACLNLLLRCRVQSVEVDPPARSREGRRRAPGVRSWGESGEGSSWHTGCSC